ncbi:Phytanoyl-CoA dioxygenase (PhyH) [compost metagenome]
MQFYLDDIDAELCPTQVVPGSHRAGRKPAPGEQQWQGQSARSILCRAGDALMFRSELWHGGSDNRSTDRTRSMLQVHYGRRMVAQKFSPYLHWQFSPEVLAAATPRQRRLLGEHAEAEYD